MSAVAQNDMDLLSLIFLQVATSQNENKNFEMNQFCDKFMQNLVKRRQNLLSAQNPVSIRAGTWIPSEFLENLPISASLVECYEKYLKNSQVASDANADFNFFKRRRISVLRERLKKNVDQLLHIAFPFGSTFPTINVTLDDDESDSPTAPVEPVTGIIASEPDVSNSPNVPSSNDNRDLEQGSNLIETPKDGKESCKETSLSSESHRQWKRQILSLLKELTSNPFSHLFLHPVRADIAPLYYDVLKLPISLNAIKQKVRDDIILTSEEVYRDLLVLVYNAKVYNGKGSVVFDEAEELLRKIKELFQGILKIPKHEE